MSTKIEKYDHGVDLQGLPLNNAPIQALSALPATTYARVVYLTTIDGANPANHYYGYDTNASAWIDLGSGSSSISDTVYGAGWNADTTHAPSKNVVYDKVELLDASITAKVDDTAYNATSWDGVTGVAPSKNAVRDKIETLDAAKANLASPTFTGDPKAPTPSTSDSDTSIATTAFVQAAIAAYVTASDISHYKGGTDASANPNYPAAEAGEFYRITVAGKIGGASGVVVEAGDVYMAIADNAGGNQATVGTSWIVLQTNIDGAVVGPVSSTSGNLPTFSSTSGKAIQDSGVALAALALLASPTFTGDPKAPTPSAGDNDTSIATTAFVNTAIGAKRYAADIGDGSTEDIVVTHGFTTRDIATLTVRDAASPYAVHDVYWEATTTTTVTIFFPTGAPPASASLRVVITI